MVVAINELPAQQKMHPAYAKDLPKVERRELRVLLEIR
jgi:hypothetical protein